MNEKASSEEKPEPELPPWEVGEPTIDETIEVLIATSQRLESSQTALVAAGIRSKPYAPYMRESVVLRKMAMKLMAQKAKAQSKKR